MAVLRTSQMQVAHEDMEKFDTLSSTDSSLSSKTLLLSGQTVTNTSVFGTLSSLSLDLYICNIADFKTKFCRCFSIHSTSSTISVLSCILGNTTNMVCYHFQQLAINSLIKEISYFGGKI